MCEHVPSRLEKLCEKEKYDHSHLERENITSLRVLENAGFPTISIVLSPSREADCYATSQDLPSTLHNT